MWHYVANTIKRQELYSTQRGLFWRSSLLSALLHTLLPSQLCDWLRSQHDTVYVAAARLKIVWENVWCVRPRLLRAWRGWKGSAKYRMKKRFNRTSNASQQRSWQVWKETEHITECAGKCCWHLCRKKNNNTVVLVCVQSILSHVSLFYVHSYMMSIAELFTLDFACRWWPCFPFGRAMMEVYGLLFISRAI